MKAQNPHMRLFNGHQKLSEESLKKMFLVNLNNIFCIKAYLTENLPVMAGSTTFVDLRNALLEDADDIKIQLLRLETIFSMLNEVHQRGHCLGIKAYIIEAYQASKEPGLTDIEKDFTILYHLKALEAIEVACYDVLHQMAQSLPNNDMSLLLQQNLDMARDSQELYQMIAEEYIGNYCSNSAFSS